ncbi:uncharacterized protein LOC112004307 [Quercus suber]|uniref:uncharacterized protein LOC112004307 n=1 Tax=Quercus suber TaxID=58331 RepID=UPI0032DE6E6E
MTQDLDKPRIGLGGGLAFLWHENIDLAVKTYSPHHMNALISFEGVEWHFMGIYGHLVIAKKDCLNSGKILSSINLTHITLIPKRKNPEYMAHFRPISLCNVIFKIVSKVLADKLKKILGMIISECQSAFVLERVITDNILISFETLHYMTTKRWGTSTHMALKLDMSKAYDRVEWDYLKALMLKMGFHPWWVNLVMAGISLVSYSVIVNGKASDSPNHLEGLDRASIEECQSIKEILSLFELASGQKVNCDKTAIFFSKNTPMDTREEIRWYINATSDASFEKYLGLPPIIGRGKKQAFAEIKLRIQSKLSGWKGIWNIVAIYTLEFMGINKRHTITYGNLVTRWSSSSLESSFRLNIAISQSKVSSTVGLGLLIRNSKGEVTAASCERIKKEIHTLWTAALVVRVGLLFC